MTSDESQFQSAGKNLNPVASEHVSEADGLKTAPTTQYSPIGIQDEGNVLHLSVSESFLKRHSELFESCARLFNVVNSNSYMSEATSRLAISTRISLEVRVGLRSVIVRQFQNA